MRFNLADSFAITESSISKKLKKGKKNIENLSKISIIYIKNKNMKCYKIKMAQIDNSHVYFEKKKEKKKDFFEFSSFEYAHQCTSLNIFIVKPDC